MRRIILGPPGTGKTTTLIKLVEKELQSGVLPEKVGYLAFTKKAATEAIERACEKFKLTSSDFPYFRTIHSFCFRCSGVDKNQIVSSSNYVEFGKSMKIDISGSFSVDEGDSFGFKEGDRMLFLSNLSRVKMISLKEQYKEDPDDLSFAEVERVNRGFKAYKDANFLLDYNDLLFEFLEKGETPDLEVLFVDEAQDLSKLQWAVVEKIAQRVKRVVIAGDDDQAIFRWAGAAVCHFIDLQADVVDTLQESHRIPRSVQKISSEILRGIRNRREKVWYPKQQEGSVKFFSDISQFRFNSNEDYLILFRNSFLGVMLRDTLKESGVLFSYKGFSSVKQNLLEAIVFWQRLLKGQEIPFEAVKKIYEYMTVNIGVKRGFKGLQNVDTEGGFTLNRLIENHGLLTTKIWHEALDKITYYDKQYLIRLLKNGVKFTDKPRIHLSTIHGAKGGEADNVIVVPDMAARTYSDFLKNREDEHRVFYVAATRTKNNLFIMSPKTNKHFPLQF